MALKAKSVAKKKSEQDLLVDYESKLQKTVAELQNTQQQLIQSEKMASLGTIAAGVAHEINNPLSFLLSNLESLEVYMSAFRDLIDRYEKFTLRLDRNLIESHSLKILQDIEGIRGKKDMAYMIGDYDSLLKESLEGVSRIREIVQSLQSFSRSYRDSPESVDLNDCIATALRVVSNELKYKCVLKKDFGVVPKIFCNPGHLLQVFINILINAAQAIQGRGTIKIKTYANKTDVCATIADSGCGISRENKARLFTPFFSTKPVGQGTGLGLSVSYGIIKALKGSIEVESELGKGSSFTVRIPFEKG